MSKVIDFKFALDRRNKAIKEINRLEQACKEYASTYIDPYFKFKGKKIKIDDNRGYLLRPSFFERYGQVSKEEAATIADEILMNLYLNLVKFSRMVYTLVNDTASHNHFVNMVNGLQTKYSLNSMQLSHDETSITSLVTGIEYNILNPDE